jgi:hypothetical protein
MKTKLLSLSLALAAFTFANAADKKAHDHDHDHAAMAGPTGGRVIHEVEPHAEFFINKDKKVEIRFLSDDNKVVAPGEQVVTVTLGDRKAPSKLAFIKDGDKLISDKAIPEGNDLPTVVQIRQKEGAKAVTEKFNLNLEQCPTCKYKEYACICDHAHDHADHDHKHEKKK